MTRLTAFCQVAALGVNFQRDRGVYQKILFELLKVLDEEKISAVQLIPEGWPQKCKVTFTDEDLKNEIVTKGLKLFNKHVDFEDDNDLLIKLIVKDGHPEWPDDIFAANLCDFAKTVFTEKEWLYLDGRKTKITTGTRYVFATEIIKHVPQKIEFRIDDRSFPVTVWCPIAQNKPPENFGNMSKPVFIGKVSCGHCGAKHQTGECPHKKRVCFTCKKDDHSNRDCPENQGVKQNDDTFLFYSSKCPLSNWNQEYPFRVDYIEYTCVEQFMTVEKAYYFGESNIGHRAMDLTNPKEIRDLGENIRNFDRNEWNTVCDDLMKLALKHKFSDPRARGARDFLLSTGNKVIGEANKHKYWGAGVFASDTDALDSSSWSGSNTLGQYLMAVRDEIRLEDAEAKRRAQGAENRNGSGNNQTGNVSQSNDPQSAQNTSFNEACAAAAPPIKYAVVFGDGNVPKNISKTDDSLPLKLIDLSKSEMKFTDIEDASKQCMVPKDDVDYVVLHAGSAHWHENYPIEPAQTVFKQLQDAVTHTCNIFPKADFVLSGTPLRDHSLTGESVDELIEINKEIVVFNKLLFEFAQSERNIIFSDNSNILVSDKLPEGSKKHYENSVLLSEEGKCILYDNLKKGISDAVMNSYMSGGGWTQVSSQHGPPHNP